MLAFTLRRAIQAIGVMIAVGIISFSMFRFAGDPVNQIVSLDTSAAERAEVRKSLGLDDPVALQFVRYLGNAVQFKFGVSYQFRQPVASLLAERMPATLELAICATILAMVFGILMGVYSALRRDTVFAKILQAVSLIGISLPTFLIGILLIYLFAVILGWLPSFGRGDVVRIGWWSTGRSSRRRRGRTKAASPASPRTDRSAGYRSGRSAAKFRSATPPEVFLQGSCRVSAPNRPPSGCRTPSREWWRRWRVPASPASVPSTGSRLAGGTGRRPRT